MKIDFDKLKDVLRFAVVKKNKKSGFGKTSSVAYSKSNRNYTAGNLASDTNLLDITSEQAVLVLAVQNNDFQINKIITLVEGKNHQQVVSPLVLKILRDFEIRTGTKIRYIIVDKKKDILFDIKDISSIMSFYNPPIKILTKTKKVKVSKNWVTIDNKDDIKLYLKKYAILGIKRNFSTYDSATGYGTSILTNKNNLYFGGQYSSFDKRVGLHSEMATALSVLMSGKNEKITHLGLVSTKFEKEPCNICGCCSQFLFELIQRYGFDIEFFCFAKKTNTYNKYSINQLLPFQWSSKNL